MHCPVLFLNVHSISHLISYIYIIYILYTIMCFFRFIGQGTFLGIVYV